MPRLRFIAPAAVALCAMMPLPPARQAIIDAGGLIPYARARLMAR